MSKIIENYCVSCDLHCIGTACPYRGIPVYYCDDCGQNRAEYRVEEYELCAACAEARIQEIFDDLTLLEKAKAVEVDCHGIEE